MNKTWSIFLMTFILVGFIALEKGEIVANAAKESFSIFGIKINYESGDEDDYEDTVKYENGEIVSVDSEYKAHKAWRNIFDKYQGLLVGFWGLGLITTVGIFIKLFLKLGATASNPNERAKTLQGILFAGIGTALLGSAGIVFSIFYHALG